VVATGDATTRLDDGQLVTVDGGAGTIHPTSASVPSGVMGDCSGVRR
jgi:phosphohistidine swiveling domain-containing protein